LVRGEFVAEGETEDEAPPGRRRLRRVADLEFGARSRQTAWKTFNDMAPRQALRIKAAQLSQPATGGVKVPEPFAWDPGRTVRGEDPDEDEDDLSNGYPDWFGGDPSESDEEPFLGRLRERL
jgi:hypothetical protein